MKIKKVRVNARKKALEIDTEKGTLCLPFSKLDLRPTPKNRIKEIYIDPELGNRGVTYVLESDDEDSIHLDAFLDYNRDPDFLRQLTLHKLSIEASRLMEGSGLSKHEIIRRMKTSPSQLYRLLDPANYQKSVDQMLRLIAVLGYRVEVSLKKEAA